MTPSQAPKDTEGVGVMAPRRRELEMFHGCSELSILCSVFSHVFSWFSVVFSWFFNGLFDCFFVPCFSMVCSGFVPMISHGCFIFVSMNTGLALHLRREMDIMPVSMITMIRWSRQCCCLAFTTSYGKPSTGLIVSRCSSYQLNQLVEI